METISADYARTEIKAALYSFESYRQNANRWYIAEILLGGSSHTTKNIVNSRIVYCKIQKQMYPGCSEVY